MTLQDFISPLRTKEVKVTLLDSDDHEIIKFFSDGYSGVESEILARPVHRWEITSASAISVELENASVTPATDTTTEETPAEETTTEP